MSSAALSKSEQAHAFLSERIAAGSYAHGERIVLGRVAAELGMSVVPVREAVRRLEAEGVVTFQRNVGATIASIDPEEYMHTMQTLGVVEAAATALAAPLLTPEDLREAHRLNEEMRAGLEDFDPQRFTDLNAALHRVLHGRCCNPHLSDLVERGWARLDRLRRSTFAFIPNRARSSVEEHDEILRLIEERAGYEAVEQAARRHRWNTLAAFQEAHAAADSPENRQTT
ncbi:GntR family transcriptional regulator [Arthrobacter sp. UM1]|uniref:GntR family transcriptional regulator n=1 Tax=Arthrobacter sp. UM1 TaxID=2766776 RepID=UPI001CF6F34C|nr:GntR family transcriptional regulator [Arthrobacter sp. UM1]MCB4207900.1 GntR family transcriptional regulator [Arthrobacter sp. UM1]